MKMESSNTQRLAAGGGALALLVAAVGPWVTVLGALSAGPTSSTELSAVVFGGIAVLLLSAAIGRYIRPVTIVVGLAVLGEAVHTIVRIEQFKSSNEWGSVVSPGWGLFLAVVAGLFLLVSTWIVRRREVAVA